MTREQTVTNTPTALVGITNGKNYFLQNSGGFNSARWLRVAVKTSLADVNHLGGYALQFGQGEVASTMASESIYVWHNGGPGDNFVMAYDEVA